MISALEQFVSFLSQHLPLFVFTPLASFVEEAIPPIPSPSVMMISGFLAAIQNYSFWLLAALVVVGSIGKTAGAWLVYYIMDKVEDILSGRWSSFIGISHQQIESFGSRLGKGYRDYFILIFLRALPIVPSTLLTVGGGLLKVPLKLFLISTVVGSLLRNGMYLYLGYVGSAFALSLVNKSTSIESAVQIIVGVIIVIILGYFYWRRLGRTKSSQI